MTSSTDSNSPLRLDFATLDDLSEITELWYNAFTTPGLRAIWPDTPGVRQWWHAANQHDMLHKPREKYLKVVDTAQNGRIVAYAKWSLQTAEERGARWPAWHPDMDPVRNDAFLHQLETCRATLVGGGRPNFCRLKPDLDMLATHTAYRRMGAARLLLEWGCQAADEAGVPIYIDASQSGKPVYERLGFEDRSYLLGGDTGELAAMVRDPRKSSA
ncbi:GNAT family N-acetyltransferase [Aspergillus ibericus CBS 121593]|uniref:Acetyltransferase n=1 Tax=Aspergillus ibericus CBS 121593 TaxID=1448316 RepID=A0A395GMI2_9EURO|nr:acetyltransferase [Aspergillus ibericus CBS 121593]RAK95223.1 acetyltransferase [Aspergillus ibericus CBS 121593]